MFFFDFSKNSLHRFDSAGKELWSAPLNFGSAQGGVASMAVASDGVYLAGQVNGTLPGQTSVGSYDAFAVKYDLNGKVLWTRQFGTPDSDFVSDIVLAPDGTYMVGGTGAGVGGTMFIRRSDAAGNEIWTRRFDPGNLVDIIGAAADSTGIYFVGMTTAANYNVLRKFDSAGNDLWTYQLDRFSIIVGIAPDEHGVYVSFYRDGGGPIATVRRLDLTGSEIWTRQIVTSYAAGSIVADSTGFYLSGETYSALPGQCYSGQGDVFLMRFDVGGNPIWTREFGTAGAERPASISIGSSSVDVTGFDSSNRVFLTTISKASQSVADPRPRILWECVLNAASYLGGGVAPGEIVTVLGSGIGPSTLARLQVSSDGHIPTSLAGARILFDGEASPLIYVSDMQSSAIVPFDIAGKTSVHVQVEYNGVVSSAVNVPVFESRLGIFSFNASGGGQAAVVNEDGTVNSPANPARRGSVVSIYATGGGLTQPAGADDLITGDGATTLNSSAYVRLVSDGSDERPYFAAQVLYYGVAARSVPGLVQINAQLPDSVPPGDAVPIYVGFLPALGIEQAVTIAIR